MTALDLPEGLVASAEVATKSRCSSFGILPKVASANASTGRRPKAHPNLDPRLPIPSWCGPKAGFSRSIADRSPARTRWCPRNLGISSCDRLLLPSPSMACPRSSTFVLAPFIAWRAKARGPEPPTVVRGATLPLLGAISGIYSQFETVGDIRKGPL